MIKFVGGDVTEVSCDVILHQVNCKGSMGSGVALAIKQKFPEVYEQYTALVHSNTGVSSDLLGTLQLCKTNRGVIVANMFGQNAYGHGQKHTNYEAIKTCIIKLNSACKGMTIALPYKMSCDRGGGDWTVVMQFITDYLVDCNVIIVQFNK